MRSHSFCRLVYRLFSKCFSLSLFLSLSVPLYLPSRLVSPSIHPSHSFSRTHTHIHIYLHGIPTSNLFETPGLTVYETREGDQVQACLRCGRERLSPTASPGLESSALLSPHLLLVRRPRTSATDGSSYVVSFLHHEGRNGTDYGRDEECAGKERRGSRRRKL